MEKGKTILISKMYNNNNSAYSQQGQNIVHEAINLISSDDHKNYIYIVPNGTIQGKEKRDNIGCVLLVRKASWKGTVEVLAKAENLTYLGEENKEIKYNGIPLNEYYESNLYKGKEDQSKINITFQAEKMYTLKEGKRVYITNDKSLEHLSNDSNHFIYIEDKKVLNQSQRLYIDEKHSSKDYERLLDIINKQIWNKDNLPTLKDKEKNQSHCNGFIQVLGQQYNELAYSNLFAYLFDKYRDAFCKFWKETLGIDLSRNFTIRREYKHIDLLVQDENNYIVIENKIRSGINGIKAKTNTEKTESQLSDYYRIAEQEGKSKNKYFLIFAPEYECNLLSSVIEAEKLEYGDVYKIVSYNDIYKYYSHCKINDPFFKEFMFAIKYHSKSTDNVVDEEMIQRMLKIKEQKN